MGGGGGGGGVGGPNKSASWKFFSGVGGGGRCGINVTGEKSVKKNSNVWEKVLGV